MDKKISQFETIINPAENDIILINHNGSTKTIELSSLKSFFTAQNSISNTVGDAKAGIFRSAVCFIPSASGTGFWTAPAGCTSARVTVVGGGAGYNRGWNNGGRSHFNYPSGTTTSANQLYAEGGQGSTGGRAGWCGYNNLAVGGTAIEVQYTDSSTVTQGTDGIGGFGGGGFGGGGGGGGGIGGFGGGSWRSATPQQTAEHSGVCGIQEFSIYNRLSYIAETLPNYKSVMEVSRSAGVGGSQCGGGGWCTAIVEVTAGVTYTYAVAGDVGSVGKGGLVIIEW